MQRNYLSLRHLLTGCLLMLAIVPSYSQQTITSHYPSPQQIAHKMHRLDSLLNNKQNGISSISNFIRAITGPEQDCSGALYVCSQSYTQSSSYTGYGSYQEVYSTCLSAQEQNTVWYVFTVQNSGTFGFTLQTLNDYDFALYDITSIGCSGVPSATPDRCNFSGTYGQTGLSLPPSATIPLSVNASGSAMMPGLNVTSGSTYALVIDNYTGDENGYDLDFVGTALISDAAAPSLSSVSYDCSEITVTFSEPVLCSSIAANGSDFSVNWTGPTITGATGVNCSFNGLTTQATITFTGTSTSGTYTVSNAGGSGITDKCGNTISGGTDTFDYLGPISITPSASEVCSGNTSQLTATNVTGATYSWDPSGSLDNAAIYNPTATPNNTTTYTTTVTWSGCTNTASQTVTVTPTPVISLSPMNPTICSGTVNLVATSTIDGNACSDCDYSWNAGAYTENGVASSTWAGQGAGTYNVTVTSSIGCVGNSATTTVSNPSTPPSTPSCNVYFAKASGGCSSGTTCGTESTNPSTLDYALTQAQCNDVVIQLAIGTYTINNEITLNSFITLEGGYSSDFSTKTNDPATPSKIYRSSSNVDGLPSTGRLIAIEAISASYFRLQDLTIEVANGPAATGGNPKGVSTYALHLSSCSNYDIVRCIFIQGDASNGFAGTAGTGGLNGQNFNSVAGNGENGCSDPDGDSGMGGYGGGASGIYAEPGSAGSGIDLNCSGTSVNGGAGFAGSPSIDGGGGGGGGSSMYNGGVAGNGGNGGNGGGGANGSTAGGAGGNDNSCSYNGTERGGDGGNGTAGAAGSAGAGGATGSIVTYWQPGGIGGTGTSGDGGGGGKGGGGGTGDPGGFLCSISGVGAGGGGGGGGGQGGTGGTGGYGGGSSYSVFLVTNGANGNIVDCSFTAGTLGSGGTGGGGGSGGSVGTGGAGGCADDCTGSGEGDGGDGGAGGTGGNGGAGGSGSNGEAVTVKTISGTALATNSTLTLASQEIITVANINCTSVNISHANGSTPDWTFNGSGSDGTNSGASSPRNTTYPTTGRKTVSTDFAIANAAQSLSNTTSYSIPENDCATGATSTINVSGYGGTVATANITAEVKTLVHQNDGDLELFLVAPNGDILGLSNNIGGAGNNYTNTVLSDAAGSNITTGSAPYTSTYKPQGTFTGCLTANRATFGAIGGGAYNPNGNWSLRVFDNAISTVSVNVVVRAETYANEISWEIKGPSPATTTVLSGSGYSGGSGCPNGNNCTFLYSGNINLALGTYTFYSHDASSDGWDGGGYFNVTPPAPGTGTGTIFPAGAGTNKTFIVSAPSASISNWELNLPAYNTTVTETYSDFNNALITAPSAGTILASTPGICSGIAASFETSLAGNAGYSYAWTSTNSPTISDPTGENTDITFTGGPYTATVTLTVTSTCCGALTGITKDIDVYPSPAAPTASPDDATPCVGGDAVLTATLPAGANFSWYDAASGGTLLGTGATYNVTGVTAGAQNYWVETIDANGCLSATRTQVTVTGTAVSAPSTSTNGSTCSPGDVTMEVSDPSAISYNWYSGSCGGTLVQSGPSLSYTTTMSGVGVETYYVSMETAGCDESQCVTVTATVTSSPSSATWTGTVSTDWFTVGNWNIACLPACVTDVTIPSGPSNQPLIDFNSSNSPAQCKDITIASGSSLTFDTKGNLNVCGDFTNLGTLTMSSKGKVTFGGGTNQVYINNGGTGDFYNVTVNTTSLTITDGASYGDLTISSDGFLSLQSGIIITKNTRAVVVKNTSPTSVSGQSTSAYINGNITRYIGASGSYDFPTGNSDAYQLLNLNITSTSGLSYITTRFGNYTYSTGTGLPISWNGGTFDAILNNGGAGPSTGHSEGGIWTVTPNAGTANYDVTLHGRNYDNMGTAEAHVVKRSTFCPGVWALAGTFGSSTESGSVVINSSTGESGFSQLAIARNNSPLPIELLGMTGVCEGNSVKLNWFTATEQNNDHFTIEKSVDGFDFEVVGTVPGAGNSNNVIAYEYLDVSTDGILYYRLKQTDVDGATKNVTTIAVNCNDIFELELISIVPNPTQSKVNVLFNARDNENVYVKLFDTRSRMLISDNFLTTNGLNHYQMDFTTYDEGVYYFTINNGISSYVRKIIKIQ